MSPLVMHDTGAGHAVLLLHAFPLDASQWDHQVAALSDRYRCLRPDFPGFGGAPDPEPGLTLDGYAVTLLGDLDALGVREIAVVGLSLGGYVAFALLRAAPSRVRAVVLADTRASADTDETRAGRRAMAGRVVGEGVESLVEPTAASLLAAASRREPHIADPVRARIRRASTAGIAAAQEAMASRPDSTPLLATIAVPTLVICGSEDATSTPAIAGAMAAAIPGARLEIIDGAGHLSNLERPEAFSARLGVFLDEACSA